MHYTRAYRYTEVHPSGINKNALLQTVGDFAHWDFIQNIINDCFLFAYFVLLNYIYNRRTIKILQTLSFLLISLSIIYVHVFSDNLPIRFRPNI